MHSESANNRIKVNKRHWDAIAVRDWTKRSSQLRQIKDGAPYLEQVEPKIAPYLRDIKGKKVIVLQFGDGLVLLACAKRGALVTGVDFSREQVRLAREAAKYCGVKVKLVKADCQHLPKSVPDSFFDFAVAECGIFIWIEDLDAWMRNVRRALKKGGRLVVSDFHPISICAEGWREGETITFTRSYFDQQPRICKEENAPPSIEFTWKLSDVINAAINAGFRIDHVEEFYVKEKVSKALPLLPTDFLIVATKR